MDFTLHVGADTVRLDCNIGGYQCTRYNYDLALSWNAAYRKVTLKESFVNRPDVIPAVLALLPGYASSVMAAAIALEGHAD